MRILFVAPSCFPVYGPEANVNAKVVKLLSEAGYTIDLVTGKTSNVHYKIDNDDVFFHKVESIHNVPRNNKPGLKAIIEYVRTFIKTGHIYKSIAGALPMIKKCEELIARNKYDFIFTKDYPSEVVGLYITKKYGIPWVPTWNDPYMMVKFPAPYGKGYDYNAGFFRERLIKALSKAAYRHAFPSARLRDYMLKYMTGMKPESCVVIPHLLTNEFVSCGEPLSRDELTLIYAGSLSKERDPQTFFDGFNLFLKDHPDAKIKVMIMGVYEGHQPEYISDLFAKNGLSDHFVQLPRATYMESNLISAKYDVNLILEADCEEGIFLPSKVPNCLQCQRTLMAVSPRIGTLNDLYNEGIVEYFADVSSPENIAAELGRLYGDYRNGQIYNVHKDISRFADAAVLKLHQTIFDSIKS